MEIVGVHESVQFYPACGNETLDHQGVQWYQVAQVGFDAVDPELGVRRDELLAVEREESPVAEIRRFARVPPPSPGDDIGTLVVWADGVARWVSDSGELDTWMTDDGFVYTWEC